MLVDRAFPVADHPVVGLVEEAQVDVAAEVQLAAPELAHAERHEGHGAARGVTGHAPPPIGAARASREGRLERSGRQASHLGARLVHVGEAKDLPQGDAHHGAMPEAAKDAAQGRLVVEVPRRLEEGAAYRGFVVRPVKGAG